MPNLDLTSLYTTIGGGGLDTQKKRADEFKVYIEKKLTSDEVMQLTEIKWKLGLSGPAQTSLLPLKSAAC